MPRPLLDETKLHPAIREKVATHHLATVDEVRTAVAAHRVVVVGMAINPVPRKARAFLGARGIPFHYISYGSYFSEWRRRTALKMWTGWPTFPMIFIDGVLVGGLADLVKLAEAGELEKLRG